MTAGTGASFARGASEQDYATPECLLAPIRARFRVAQFDWDLAASTHNTKGRSFLSKKDDALSVDWTSLPGREFWLNPPFAKIAPWAEKCAASVSGPRRIFLLVPAAVGSNWYAQHVHGRARVLFLNGRIPFIPDKPTWGYPKDCMLAVYGEILGCDVWRWRP